MKTIKVVLIFSIFFQPSCNSSVDIDGGSNSISKYSLPSSNGTHNELTIFCDDDLWKLCGRSFVEELARPVLGLPQNESKFDLSRLPIKSISQITRRSKSILSIIVIPDSSSIIVKKNVWSEPQLVIQIIAPSAKRVTQLFKSNATRLIKQFERHDNSILLSRISRNSQKNLPESLKKVGIKHMLIPKGYKTTLDKKDIKILRADTKKSIQYLIAWAAPYFDSIYDTEAVILSEQNKLLKKYFEGAENKSFLKIETDVSIDLNYSNIDGKYVIEHLGLFRTEGGFGGGPFVTYTFFDEKQNKRISMTSLVYAPSSKKRKMMLELEAALSSIRIN